MLTSVASPVHRDRICFHFSSSSLSHPHSSLLCADSVSLCYWCEWDSENNIPCSQQMAHKDKFSGRLTLQHFNLDVVLTSLTFNLSFHARSVFAVMFHSLLFFICFNYIYISENITSWSLPSHSFSHLNLANSWEAFDSRSIVWPCFLPHVTTHRRLLTRTEWSITLSAALSVSQSIFPNMEQAFAVGNNVMEVTVTGISLERECTSRDGCCRVWRCRRCCSNLTSVSQAHPSK